MKRLTSVYKIDNEHGNTTTYTSEITMTVYHPRRLFF